MTVLSRKLSLTAAGLERLTPTTTGTLLQVPCFEDHGYELFEAACRRDFEGIVAKRKADPYGTRTPGTRSRTRSTPRPRAEENCSSRDKFLGSGD